jgi:hypothetical protein
MGLLDAPALTKATLTKVLTPSVLPNPVVNVTGNVPVALNTNGGNRTYNNTTTIPRPCYNVQLVFACGMGIYPPSTTTGLAQNTVWPQDSTIGVTLLIQNQQNGQSFTKIVTWGGQTTAKITPLMQSLVSDPLNIQVPPAYITVQTYITTGADSVLNGGATGVPGTRSRTTGTPRVTCGGSTTPPTTLNPQYPGALPFYFTGTLSDPCPIWLGMGDSIISGAGDGGTQVGGWFMRALNNAYPVQRISVSGYTAQGMAPTSLTTSTIRSMETPTPPSCSAPTT